MLVFLFTDIEGSSKLWEAHTEVMTGVIARHEGDIALVEILERGSEATRFYQRVHDEVKDRVDRGAGAIADEFDQPEETR